MTLKDVLRKVWHFLWEDDSIWSWLANLVIAFVVIKYLVYPFLGLLMGTSFPIVAVVSGSMEHDGSFDDWWESVCRKDITEGIDITQGDIYSSYNITKEKFKSFSFKNGFNKGDLMVLISAKKADLGDIIVFMGGTRADPIIHRAVNVEDLPKVFKTKGDHNCVSAPFESAVPDNKVVGKAVLRIPFLGWVKLAFVGLIQGVQNVLS